VNAKVSMLVNYQHADRRFCALNRNATIILARHFGKRISQPLIEMESSQMSVPYPYEEVRIYEDKVKLDL